MEKHPCNPRSCQAPNSFESNLEIKSVRYLNILVWIVIVQRRIAQNHRRAYSGRSNVMLFRGYFSASEHMIWSPSKCKRELHAQWATIAKKKRCLNCALNER